MKRLEKRFRLLAIPFAFVVMLSTAVSVGARPGGGHTHSSSGSRGSSRGSSAGGSSSHGLGSSSSTSPSRSGPYSSGGGGYSGSGGRGFGAIIFLFILIFVVVLVVVVAMKLKGGSTPPPQEPDTGADLAQELQRLREMDPNFSLVLFMDFVNTLYARAQEARGKGTLDLLAPYIDQGPQQQLLAFGSAATGLREVAGVVLGTSKIVDVRNQPDATTITVFFEANYTETGQDGRQTSYYTEERWYFWRQAGVQSLPPGTIDAIHCPKCGGPLERSETGACPYCNAVVKGGTFHWFVTAIEPLARSERGPQLTSETDEEGTDLPTVYQANFSAAASQFQASNPGFSWERMNERVTYIFNKISEAWTTLQWEQARPFETDNIFQMHRYWIEAYQRQGLRNVLDQITVHKIEWVKVDQDAYYDSLTARIYASELDYTIEQAGGRLVCGSPNRLRSFTEYWTFVRTRGAKPVEHKDDHCPNCGAPLAINMAGVCQYCGGKVTSGDFDWVLSQIEQDESYTG